MGHSLYPVLPAHRQFLGCVHKFNRLIQIYDTGVRPETLDYQATGCATEPTGFFKIPSHGESHDKPGTIRIAASGGVNHWCFETRNSCFLFLSDRKPDW